MKHETVAPERDRGARCGPGGFFRRTGVWTLALTAALAGPGNAADLWGAAGHPGAAVLVGSEGRALFSTGSTHTQYQEATVPDGTGDLFDAAWNEDVNLFVAVGAAGTILVSNNNVGNAWSERASKTSSTLRGVAAFTGATRAVVVGDGGTILRSASIELGGWVSEDSPSEENLWDVVQGTTLSIIVGEGGTILRGSLDGTNWLTVDSPVTSNLYGVTVEQNGNFIAVGEAGVVLRATGDGLTWDIISTPDAKVTLWDVVGLQFTPPSVAVGSGGALWRSGDTGLSWEVEPTATNATLRAVAYTGVDFVVGGDLEAMVWSDDGFVWENVTPVEVATWGFIKHRFARP